MAKVEGHGSGQLQLHLLCQQLTSQAQEMWFSEEIVYRSLTVLPKIGMCCDWCSTSLTKYSSVISYVCTNEQVKNRIVDVQRYLLC